MKQKNLLIAGLLLFSSFTFAQQKTQKLTDPEIASVAVAANKIDIKAAQMAQKKTKTKEVINFAQTMITDHGAVLDKAVALVTKLGVTPKDNSLSKALNAGAAKTAKSLSAKSGKAFDKAYVKNEVAYHIAVINVLEKTLIPDAQNAEVKALLQSVLPAFKAHLAHAQMLDKTYK